MPNTYYLLASNTVGSGGASSITFSSIPQTGYTDLVVKVSGRCTSGVTGSDVKVSFNGVTTNITSKNLYGSGSGAGSQQPTYIPGIASAALDTASTFGNMEVYIPNYTSSNFKSVSLDAVNENNAAAAYTYLTAGLWSATSAITEIAVAPFSGNWVQYSTFYLYGIKNS
jgi:hypothetical protein